MPDVLDEVHSLAANGYQEVVLTGIHLSSYGVDLDTNLLELIKAVYQVEGSGESAWGPWNPGSSRRSLHTHWQGLIKCAPISTCLCRADAGRP